MAFHHLASVNPLSIPTRRTNPTLFPSVEGMGPPTPRTSTHGEEGLQQREPLTNNNNNNDAFDFSNSPKATSIKKSYIEQQPSIDNISKNFNDGEVINKPPTPEASPQLISEQQSFENLSSSTDGSYVSASEEAGTAVTPNPNEVTEEENTATSPNGLANLSTVDFPFLRALHTFDPSSLPNNSAEDPVSICLKFSQGDIALLHSVHSSGWGDATILSSSRRGWIPTNYFTTYNDEKISPLLRGILNFVINPKSLQISGSSENRFTFSQEAITTIVAGVRSLLEACGTLTRDTVTVKKSQTIRKFRKNLLAELAILVSLAKQHRNTVDESVIERLVNGCYKIASKAILFLDVWAIDSQAIEDVANEPEYTTTTSNANSGHSHHNSVDTMTTEKQKHHHHHHHPRQHHHHEHRNSTNSQTTVITTDSSKTTTNHNNNNFAIPRAPATRRSDGRNPSTDSALAAAENGTNRESVIFLNSAPTAKQRLDEVNDALTAYLGIFIHRMGFLESDPTASTQILVNTRKSMLACRELLAAVESISYKQHPRNRELEQTKDKLFGQIRNLVTSARDVVAASSTGSNNTELKQQQQQQQQLTSPSEISSAGKKLIDIATDCARTAGECVVRCRIIIDKLGDFQMPSDREYPDFSDGVIAIPNYRIRGKDLSLTVPSYLNQQSPASPTFPSAVYNDMPPPSTTSEQFPTNSPVKTTHNNTEDAAEDQSGLLPRIPSLSPIIPANSTETSPSEANFQTGTTYKKQSGDEDGGEEIDGDEDERNKPVYHKSNGSSGGNSSNSNESSSGEHIEPEIVDASEYPEELQVIKDEKTGKIRAGSLRVMVDILTDENEEQDPFMLSTFFLTFRLYSTPQQVVDCLIDRYALNIDEDQLVLKDLEDISSRRIKVYNIFKRWLESHWKQSTDDSVLEQILDLADHHFAKVLPNSKTIIHDLAAKVTSDLLEDGEPIVPRVLSMPDGTPAKSSNTASSSNLSSSSTVSVNKDPANYQTSLSKHQLATLQKLNEMNGYRTWNSLNPLENEAFGNDNKEEHNHTQESAAASLRNVPSSTNGQGGSTTTASADTKSIHTTASSTWSSSFRIVRNSTFNVAGNGIHVTPLTVMDFEAVEIAAQLTLMDSNMFARLQPAELLGRNFGRKRGIRQDPHVAMMANFMNQLSSFVGHTVLGGDLPTKQRKNVLKQWIKIAERCLEFKNYNSMIGIVSVLQSVNIIRLKKTWETLSPRYHTVFNHLKEIASPERNFAVYRQQMRGKEPPCIPFLGVYLSDLTFLVEGNARERKFPLPDNSNRVIKVINFDLYERISKVLAEIQKFQVSYTRLTPARDLQTWLRGEMLKSHAQVSKGDELWRRSCIVEPKN